MNVLEQLFWYNITMKDVYKTKILGFYRTNRRMPNMSEIMTLLELKSRSAAFYVAQKLIEEGIVKKDTTGKLIPTSKINELKVLGRIRAGFAAPSEEEIADTITVGDYLIRHKESSYLLQVEGESMIDAGIHPGDMVIFERTNNYKPGDIVIALIEDGYTIKYLRKKNNKYYLEAANTLFPDIHPKDGQIIGVVTSTFRKYT